MWSVQRPARTAAHPRPGSTRSCAPPEEGTPASRLQQPQALKFDLIVYSPYKPIEGFLEDIKEAAADVAAAAPAPAGGDAAAAAAAAAAAEAAAGLDPGMVALSGEQLDKARAGAYSAADALMLSDAPLLHTPGRLALAALRSGFSKVRGRRRVGLVEGASACGDEGLSALAAAHSSTTVTRGRGI